MLSHVFLQPNSHCKQTILPKPWHSCRYWYENSGRFFYRLGRYYFPLLRSAVPVILVARHIIFLACCLVLTRKNCWMENKLLNKGEIQVSHGSTLHKFCLFGYLHNYFIQKCRDAYIDEFVKLQNIFGTRLKAINCCKDF